MHCFPKTFDLLSSESYASAFVLDRDFIKQLVDEAQTCHSYVRVEELRVFRQVRLQIHWVMKVIMQPKRLKLDDDRYAPVLVQLVVLGADNSQTEDRYTKYAIHWSWKVPHFRMADVHRNQIKKSKCYFLQIYVKQNH